MRKWAKPADTATDVQSTWPVVPASVREAKEERIRYQVTNKQHFQRHRTMLDDRQVGLIVPLTHSLTHLPTHSLAHSLTHSLTHPQLIYSFTHLLTHSRTHALSHSLTHSLAMSPLPCPLCQALVLERIERRRLDRYAHRGTFLLDRCRLTDDCKEGLEKLIDAYLEAEKAGHHEDDIAYMKKDLTDQQCAVVMLASKLIELCRKHGLPADLSPQTVRTAAFPYQTIANADLFGPCDLRVLIPNPKPTAHFATLPGTDKRPLKPWQLCTEEVTPLIHCSNYMYPLTSPCHCTTDANRSPLFPY